MKFGKDTMAGPPSHARTTAHDEPGLDPEATHDGRGAESSQGPSGAAAGPDPSGSISDLIRDLQAFVVTISRSVVGLIQIQSDRMRLSVRRRIAQAAIVAGLLVGMATWTVAAALALLRGACGGLTSLVGGREWLGDLLGGGLALTLAAGAIAIHVQLSARSELRRLEVKYERIRKQVG